MSAPAGRSGVIHDIGYRRYSGERASRPAIAASLLWSGILSVFGFGRSGRAKALPFALLGMTLVPALIQVGIMVFMGRLAGGEMGSQLDYSGYNANSSFLVVLFVAAQAPVLFSRDLRSGVISLYLARPLGATTFALVRWASLVLAILAFVLTPVLLLFVGGLAAGASFGDELPKVLVALGGALLLALMLGAVGAVVSSWTMRRGLAIGGTILVLLVAMGVVAGVQQVASGQGMDTLAQWLSLLSPFILADSVMVSLGDATSAFPAPADDPTTGVLLLLAALALLALALVLLVRRYRRKGA